MEEVLKPAFMAVSIIGFVVSAIWTVSGQLTRWFDPWGGENLGLSLGFSFCLIFVIMFIATMVTMKPK